MGQAKQRGTYVERVQQAQSRVTAASQAEREARFNEAQARRRAALDAEQDAVIEVGADRSIVVGGGGGSSYRSRGLIAAALIAALTPAR